MLFDLDDAKGIIFGEFVIALADVVVVIGIAFDEEGNVDIEVGGAGVVAFDLWANSVGVFLELGLDCC